MFRNAKSIVAGLSLATLVLAAPAHSFAADAPTSQPTKHEGRGGAAAERLQKTLDQLDLTDDQKKEIEPIMTKMKADLAALKADDKVSDDDKKAKMKEIAGDAMKQVAAILTPDQKAKMKQMRADAKGNKK